MARQGKTLPARRSRSATDESLLIRSAESLGRMIGSLQRQLDGASKKLSPESLSTVFRANGHDAAARTPQPTMKATAAKATGARARTAKGASKSGATKVRSTTNRESKRESKAAVSSKSAGRTRSGASRKSAKR
jgi:hypothetical protein